MSSYRAADFINKIVHASADIGLNWRLFHLCHDRETNCYCCIASAGHSIDLTYKLFAQIIYLNRIYYISLPSRLLLLLPLRQSRGPRPE